MRDARVDSDLDDRHDDDELVLDYQELDDLLADGDLPIKEVAEQTVYGEVVLDDLIRRQLTLSMSVAGVFLLMLFGLPIFNLLFPELAALPVLGLPFSWLILAVAIYPILWLL